MKSLKFAAIAWTLLLAEVIKHSLGLKWNESISLTWLVRFDLGESHTYWLPSLEPFLNIYRVPHKNEIKTQ
jgi:hypothetical protein